MLFYGAKMIRHMGLRENSGKDEQRGLTAAWEDEMGAAEERR